MREVMMQNSFFQAICRVGIFMICAQAIVHFRPQPQYEKYLKLLVSVMVLIQLFLPVGSFLLGGGGQEAAKILEQFGLDLEQSMKEAAENAAAVDAVLEQMTLEEIMRQLEMRQEDSSESLSGQEGNAQNTGEENGAAGEIEINLELKAVDPITINVTEPSKEEPPRTVP